MLHLAQSGLHSISSCSMVQLLQVGYVCLCIIIQSQKVDLTILASTALSNDTHGCVVVVVVVVVVVIVVVQLLQV